MQENKKELGQFYTTNSANIIGDLVDNVKGTKLIDPFAGNWDMLNLFDDEKYTKEGCDLDPQNERTEKRDSLLNPKDYSGYSVITNPPYLMNNKTKDPDNLKIFEKYNGFIDLYQISMHTLVRF